MKRGFTLIELLAVITVLSIIMLIAVPVVAGIIKNSKEKTREQSVELYGRAIENAISAYYVKYPLKNEVTLETLETEKLLDYKSTEVECNIVRIEERDVYLADCKVGNKKVDATYGKYIPETATADDYKGYYADVDGDGTPDGVIYADLAQSSEAGAQYYNSDGAYSYTAKTNLNEYTISKEKYTGEKAKFGEKEIIKLKKDKGNPRFYVMALENFTTEAYTDSEDSSKDYPAYTYYYWYCGAYMSPLITSNDFGEGKENTRKMIAKWNAAGTSEGYTDSPQNNRDIWKHIQTKYQQGWYIPSRGEWAAFADYFTNKTDLETKLTTSNYNITYGLSRWYWSSSQGSAYCAWYVHFGIGRMSYIDVNYDKSVRLGVTF